MKRWPALDIHAAAGSDLALAALDDFAPTALEERGRVLRAFFATPAARDEALAALSSRFAVASVEVAGDDWARRSQQNLPPITVGRVAIVSSPESPIPDPCVIAIAIAPSMGFGTGHHETTRLCLAALQAVGVADAFVIDVGTGSGVLAIAAVALGAARALAVDSDPDAIQAAGENLELNRAVAPAGRVELAVADLMKCPLLEADVVIANLTGVQLMRGRRPLASAVRHGGVLIVSGLQTNERDDVRGAYGGFDVVWEGRENEWLALALKRERKEA